MTITNCAHKALTPFVAPRATNRESDWEYGIVPDGLSLLRRIFLRLCRNTPVSPDQTRALITIAGLWVDCELEQENSCTN